MRFHKKIFIVFFGLSMMSTRGAIGYSLLPDLTTPDPIIFPGLGSTPLPVDDYTDLSAGTHYPCGESSDGPVKNLYIAKCDFTWPTNQLDDPTTPVDESKITFPGVSLTPERIFAFIAATIGYLCWDFDDPKKNYENLRILFGGDHSAKLECYTVEKGSPEEKLQLIRTNQRPLTQKVSFPYESTDNANYSVVAFALQIPCDEQSILNDPDTYCQPCPNDGTSNAPEFEVIMRTVGTPPQYKNVVRWRKFTTIADCYHWDKPDDHTHEDNTGSFKYITDKNGGTDELPEHGACYYSGE